jgi:hypothetical protein
VEEAWEPALLKSHLLGGVPGVGVVLLEMVVVHVVAAMGHLPGPVRDEDRSMGQVSKEIIEPFVFGKGSMSTIMTNDLTRAP